MTTLYVKTLTLIIAVLVDLMLALLVYRNNPRSATNKVYGFLSSIIVLWMVANFLSVLPGLLPHSLLLIRLSLFFAAAMSAFFLLFAHTMPSERLLIRRKQTIVFGLFTILAMLAAISPLAFTKVNIINNSPQPVAGPGIGLFTTVSTIYSILAVYILVKRLKRSEGAARQQTRYVLLGIALLLGLIITTVLIPVVALKDNFFVSFIPLYTIIFLGMTTIAIIRHRLFDIRSVIARSVAYLLVVTSFVLAYTGTVFIISYIFFKDPHINTKRDITYIALALVFTPTIYWLKKQFDKVTNRLFFKNAYDPQDVLNQLSKAIVAEIDLHRVLKATRSILATAVKSSFVEFILVRSGRLKLEPSKNQQIQTNIDGLDTHMKQQHKEILITEELSVQHPLKEFLSKDNVAVSLRLQTQDQPVGYILFGEKKNGDIYSKQDITLLTIVANELAVAIQNGLRFEEIQSFNATLQQKIEIATRELRKANERLKELDETKDDFISMSSHQLRTPLTSMKGYVSMVLEGDGGKVTALQKKLLTQAFASAQRMVYLISDLLNVSRLKTGKFVIEPVPTNLVELIKDEIDQLNEAATSRNLELTYHQPEHFPTLMLDETKIRQVIMNFIDNAIYYTPAGGHIEVKLVDKPDNIECTVTDDGIGVPKAERPHLFGKFYRADNAKKARPDGTGLGLFMAKKVIVEQGGALIFSSEEGKGSTFGFSFAKAPLLPKDQPAAATKPSKTPVAKATK